MCLSYVNLNAFMLKIKYLHNIWTTLNGKIDYGCSSRKERFENSNVRCNYSYKLFEHWDCKFISIIILWKICTNTIKRENFWWNRWSKNTSRYSRYFINPYDLQNHWYPIIWIFFCHVTPEFRARISNQSHPRTTSGIVRRPNNINRYSNIVSLIQIIVDLYFSVLFNQMTWNEVWHLLVF